MHHIKVIKDGNVNNVVKEQLIDGVQYVDNEPHEGSLNGITSGAVAKVAEQITTAEGDIDSIEEKIPSGASSSNKLVTESGMEDALSAIGTGYTPKGNASVATLEALTGQSNGDMYIVTDSGTLNNGALVVSAGNSVAWDSTNEVWYKTNQYATQQEHDALTTYAQNVAHSIAPEFDTTKPNDEGGYAYYAGTPVMYDGSCYVFTSNKKSGAWNPSLVEKKPLSESIQLEGVGEAVNKWLNEHPEATTTVQDHSLTKDKLVVGTLNFVTPEMFGAVGDGVSDDTAPFIAAFDSKMPLVGDKSKKYLVQHLEFGEIGVVGYNFFVENCNFIFDSVGHIDNGITLHNFKTVIFKNCSFTGRGSYVSYGDDYIKDGANTSGINALSAVYYASSDEEDSGNVFISECTFHNLRFALEGRNGHPGGSSVGAFSVDKCIFKNVAMAAETKFFEYMSMTGSFVEQSESAANLSHIFYAGVYAANPSHQNVSNCVFKATTNWPVHCSHTDDYHLVASNVFIEDVTPDKDIQGIFFIDGGKSEAMITNCEIIAPNAYLYRTKESTKLNRNFVISNCSGKVRSMSQVGDVPSAEATDALIEECNFVTTYRPFSFKKVKVVNSIFKIEDGGVNYNSEDIVVEGCRFELLSASIPGDCAVNINHDKIQFNNCVFVNSSMNPNYSPVNSNVFSLNSIVNCIFYHFSNFNEASFSGVEMSGSRQIFPLAPYIVNFNQPYNGTVEVTANGEPVESGDSVLSMSNIDATVTPFEGYEFSHWDDFYIDSPRDYGALTGNLTINEARMSSDNASKATGYDYLEFDLQTASIASFTTGGDGDFKMSSRNFAKNVSADRTSLVTTNNATALSTTDGTGSVVVTSTIRRPDNPTSSENGRFFVSLIQPKLRHTIVSFDVSSVSDPLNSGKMSIVGFNDLDIGVRVTKNIVNGHITFDLGDLRSYVSTDPTRLLVEVVTNGISFTMSNLQVEYLEETEYVAPEDRGTVVVTGGVPSGSFTPIAGKNVIIQTSGASCMMDVVKM